LLWDEPSVWKCGGIPYYLCQFAKFLIKFNFNEIEVTENSHSSGKKDDKSASGKKLQKKGGDRKQLVKFRHLKNRLEDVEEEKPTDVSFKREAVCSTPIPETPSTNMQ